MVGDHAMVMVGSHIAHDCSLGFGVTLANGVVLGGHSQVADGVVFGGVSAVHQHVRIGRLAMVAGGAMCAQDVLPLCLVRGDRARMVGLNRVGLSRAGYDLPQLSKLTRLWKRLFASGQPLPMALASLDAVERSLPEVAAWLTFIEHSTRGICRYEAQAG